MSWRRVSGRAGEEKTARNGEIQEGKEENMHNFGQKTTFVVAKPLE